MHNFNTLKNAHFFCTSFIWFYPNVILTATSEFSSCLCLNTSALLEDIIAEEVEPASFRNSAVPNNCNIFLLPILFLLSATFVRDLHCPQTCIFCRWARSLPQRERKRNQQGTLKYLLPKTNTSPSPDLLEESRILSSCPNPSLRSFSVMLYRLLICSYAFRFCSLLCFCRQPLSIL